MKKPILNRKDKDQKDKILHSIIKRIIKRSNYRSRLFSKHSLPSKIFVLPIENKSVNELLNGTNYFQSLNVISSNSLITFFQQPEYLDKILNNHIYMYTENMFEFIEKWVMPHLCCIKYSYKDDIPWFLSLFYCAAWKALLYNLISSPIFFSQQLSSVSPIANTTSSILVKNSCVEIIRHIPLDIIKSYDVSSIFIRQKHDLQMLTSNDSERELLDIQNISVYLHECKDTTTHYIHAINIKAIYFRDKIDKYIASNNKTCSDCDNTVYTTFCDEKLKHIMHKI